VKQQTLTKHILADQFSEVLVDVDLVPIVVEDGGKPQVEEVVVVVEGTQLEQRDRGAVVVVALSLLVLEMFDRWLDVDIPIPLLV